MMKASEWTSRTFATGKKRSPELKKVDEKLEVYLSRPSPFTLNQLCEAIEAWAESKKPGPQGSGYDALKKSDRNKRGAVQELITDVRQIAGKPGYWPDTDQGTNYIVQLDEDTVTLLRDMRFAATQRSVAMIAAMEVDWMAFGFDQLNSASSLAIDLGHTTYGPDWERAKDNQTVGGQVLYNTYAKIFSTAIQKANDELVKDERLQYALSGIGLGINVVLGVLKYHLFKEGVLSKAVPLMGPLKDAVTTIGSSAVDFRLAHNSFRRVDAARSLIIPNSDAASAIEGFHSLLIIETTKSAVNLAYRLIKDTALVVTEILTMGAMTVVQVVTAIVEAVVGFVYQLVYSLVFRKSVAQCREWVQAGAAPEDLDFRSWIAACPLLGAYFIIGLSAGGGATTALSMFSQTGAVSSSDFQSASVKLMKVRQAAAAYVKASPVKVSWSGPNAEQFKYIKSLIDSDALSASVGLNITKIHHYSLSGDASLKTKFKHKFLQYSNDAWSLFKTGVSVV
ncbi:hypothetical protein BH23GEM7_BH23GEM7_11970 [soil metagenome]|nr:hypothetical protein [Gemmatimonadota bacterium]